MSLRVYQDREGSLRLLRDHDPSDAEGFSELYEKFKAFGKAFLPIYCTPLPSIEDA